MNLDQTIKNTLDLLNESYQGKFKLTDITPGIWKKILRDIDTESILAAVYHLCSTRPDWPPDLATVRSTALGLSKGVLKRKTGFDAWESILKKIQDEDHPLTELEKKALGQTKSMYDLRLSQTIVADRSTFIKAYDHLSERERLNDVTLPEVKQMVARNTPALPAPVTPKQLPPQEDCPTPSEISGLIGKLREGMSR